VASRGFGGDFPLTLDARGMEPSDRWAATARGPTHHRCGEGVQAGQVGSDFVDRVGVTGPAHEGIKVLDFS
jgi:hypothetical protein